MNKLVRKTLGVIILCEVGLYISGYPTLSSCIAKKYEEIRHKYSTETHNETEKTVEKI